MGTLFNQSEREKYSITHGDVESMIIDIKGIAKKHKITFAQVIEIYKLKEHQRRNNLFVSNGDIFDEQMAGIGEILQKIALALANSEWQLSKNS